MMAQTSSYFLTPKQASDALGVTRATLYAYASRGQLRSEAVPGRPRDRRYGRDHVQRLVGPKTGRRERSQRDAAAGPGAAAGARGVHWGGRVLESGFTLIHAGRLYYRGRDALAL